MLLKSYLKSFMRTFVKDFINMQSLHCPGNIHVVSVQSKQSCLWSVMSFDAFLFPYTYRLHTSSKLPIIMFLALSK